MAINTLIPWALVRQPVVAVAGIVIGLAGLSLSAPGVAAVIRHRTTIVPHRLVATLLTDGVYRISRNPMYTGLAIAYLGLALLLGSWWPLVLWPLVIVAVRLLVIRPEEAYLTQRFGGAYAEYQSRTRRWLQQRYMVLRSHDSNEYGDDPDSGVTR